MTLSRSNKYLMQAQLNIKIIEKVVNESLPPKDRILVVYQVWVMGHSSLGWLFQNKDF